MTLSLEQVCRFQLLLSDASNQRIVLQDEADIIISFIYRLWLDNSIARNTRKALAGTLALSVVFLVDAVNAPILIWRKLVVLMFMVVQMPLCDLRPLIEGQRGRLKTPDWTEVNLHSGFVRGFGKVSPRNSTSYGLGGESAYADMDNAIRFIDRIEFMQDGWPSSLQVVPWFRRLYFDGHIAGRFELGFLADPNAYDLNLDAFNDSPINPANLAGQILSSNVQINSVDGSKQQMPLEQCGAALASAYIAATTSNKDIMQYPVTDTLENEVFVGQPFLHLRVPSALPIAESRDRREIVKDPELFITSAQNSKSRGNVLVQSSQYDMLNESGTERTTRVLFAHLHALVFANSRLVKSAPDIAKSSDRATLKRSIEHTIDRFEKLQPTESEKAAREFTGALQQFASAHAGGIDRLVDKLENLTVEFSKPTTFQQVADYVGKLIDLVVTTAVKTSVETTIKGGP